MNIHPAVKSIGTQLKLAEVNRDPLSLIVDDDDEGQLLKNLGIDSALQKEKVHTCCNTYKSDNKISPYFKTSIESTKPDDMSNDGGMSASAELYKILYGCILGFKVGIS